MGALSIRQVRKSYGAHEILKSIDIDVERGEFLILVGPRAAASPRCCR
jgi:multiple sugar transport system ATP-binding protein